ncbi:MAG: hypothetical protein ABW133_02220 [Polyangiaceae bacterium]
MMGLSNWKIARGILVAATAVSASAFLVASNATADGPPPLPPEAYAACQSKNAGDACGVQFNGHEMTGVCTSHPTDGRLFCMPNRPPGPPPEAFTACEGKKVSDACTVQMHGHELNGTCIQTPDSRLVCAPPHPGGPPPR